MLGRTNAGGGGSGGKVAVTIYGGANEVISYSGKEVGTVTLSSTGQGIVELKKGAYVFTAGLSAMTISKSIDSATIVRLRPDRYIYWYGAINGEITQYDGFGTLTFQDNTLMFQGGYKDWGACSSNIDCSQDTKVSAKCTTVVGGSNCDLLYSSYKNYTGGESKDLKANATVSLTYTYNSARKAMLAVYGNTNKIVVTEWYLGNREAA